MTARFLGRSEARLAADHLARAEAWVDQVAPELQAEIARIRAQLLQGAEQPPFPDAHAGVRRDHGQDSVISLEEGR